MELTQIIVFFVAGFLFGLMYRLFYAKISGNPQRPIKELRPIKRAKYISPKFDEYPEMPGKKQDSRSKRKAVNQ